MTEKALSDVLPPVPSRRLARLKPRFVVLPVTDGRVDEFEITPPLQPGTRFDSKTGETSGVPENVTAAQHQTFEVFGHNPVGVSGCKLSLDIIARSFDIINVRFFWRGVLCRRATFLSCVPVCPTVWEVWCEGRESLRLDDAVEGREEVCDRPLDGSGCPKQVSWSWRWSVAIFADLFASDCAGFVFFGRCVGPTAKGWRSLFFARVLWRVTSFARQVPVGF